MEIAVLITALIILGGMNIALLYMLHTQARTFNEQQGKAMKAVMSRNINDYIAATQVEKAGPAQISESDEVYISDAEDAVWDKYIQQQNS